jgi:7-cyano-7-deazaguanine reductase
MNIDALELGRRSEYDMHYNPNKLLAIPRLEKRLEIGIDPKQKLPFFGHDTWNHYEVSWLNPKGKPMVAIATIDYDCHSSHIIESKSMKLYFNSFNHTKLNSIEELEQTVTKDIQDRIHSAVKVKVMPLQHAISHQVTVNLQGTCIDELDIECHDYMVNPLLLKTHPTRVEETLHSNLLKSNCLVTLQPDWGSVEISYTGNQIDHASLLQYLVSFRNHNEFHEQCIERIFVDISRQCQPEKLSVYGRYTRRGGIDINPFRSSEKNHSIASQHRLIRQ